MRLIFFIVYVGIPVLFQIFIGNMVIKGKFKLKLWQVCVFTFFIWIVMHVYPSFHVGDGLASLALIITAFIALLTLIFVVLIQLIKQKRLNTKKTEE